MTELDRKDGYFNVAAPGPVCTWTFYAAGFFPKHLPDDYTGEVILANLDPATIPPEVQGVWHGGLFWAPGAPGNTLYSLTGGISYSVLVNGACVWTIPLPGVDYLSMSKGELYNSLISGNVASAWWSLDYTYRRELGLKIVKLWSYDYFDRSAIGHAYGGPNCTDPPTFNPYLEPEKTILGKLGLGMEHASAYRHVLFSDISPAKAPNNVFWWKSHHGTAIDSDITEHSVWKCYEPGVRFNLPMGVALGATDWLNTLQVAEDVGKLESWIFFQTGLIDGYPGCDNFWWPFDKYGRSTYISRIDSINSRGVTRPGEEIAVISW